MTVTDLELKRLSFQEQLDLKKDRCFRNKMGQFATPADLAIEILKYAKDIFPRGKKVKFLDPAIGTGAFYSALLNNFPQDMIESSKGYEIDDDFAEVCNDLWSKTSLIVIKNDFTRSTGNPECKGKANLIICNPPYSRHHHLEVKEKERLRKVVRDITNIEISGLAGYYCYFILISHYFLEKNGIAGWLIPSEFMDVNYGVAIKDYLLNNVTLLRIHRFNPNDLQFEDALVSSAIVWFKNQHSPQNHTVEFSYGGSLLNPEICKKIPLENLREAKKWSMFPMVKVVEKMENEMKLSDFFQIKRGIATGANKFFILDEKKVEEIGLPKKFLKPILPSPKLVPDEIFSDNEGNPLIERKLYLIDCGLDKNTLKSKYPNLWKYYEMGQKQGIHKRYLCSHRNTWYKQEQREPSVLLCSYMGRSDERKKTFRFIYNHSKAIATNVYLMLYPTEKLQPFIEMDSALLYEIWEELNKISQEEIIHNGRFYGGGLHKIEPKELAEVSAERITKLIEKEV